jgi:hypothetical protein
MLRQDAEVVVVDYSCPEGSGDYVARHFPAALVVRVDGMSEYSHAKSHNAGALKASGEVLIFCDADTIVADHAVEWIDENLPPDMYGRIPRESAERFADSSVLSRNQLCGFQVIPAATFRALNGFDEVLRGYADGADVDIGQRLQLIGLGKFALSIDIIRDILPHGDVERLQHYPEPISKSYAAGLVYNTAKMSLMRLRGQANLPLQTRQTLYDAAAKAAESVGSSQDKVSISFTAEKTVVGMPLQLGYRSAVRQVSLTVELSALEPVDDVGA